MSVQVDPKRTGVKAREIPTWPQPSGSKAAFYGEPGDVIRTREGLDGPTFGFVIACPGCGQFGSITVSPDAPVRWTVEAGNVEDVTTLTLTPSIKRHCCGWHGYLRNGAFKSC